MGRGRWPSVSLAPERFAVFLAARVEALEPADPSGALDQLALADLYLAAACLEGDREALACFEAELSAVARAAFRHLRLPGAHVPDLEQDLLAELLVSAPERGPGIGRYGGRGPLRSWLRIIAVRAAGRHLDRSKREVPMEEDALEEMIGPAHDEELAYLQHVHRRDFEAALRESLASLSPRERNVLRLRYLDGLQVDEIARVYRVHRMTVSRWLTGARETALGATRAMLTERLAVTGRDLDSLLRLVQSRIDFSLRNALDPSGSGS